jgi:hypothetical protein
LTPRAKLLQKSTQKLVNFGKLKTEKKEVQYFDMSSKESHKLDDEIWPVFEEDLNEKISPPKVIEKGKF